MFIFIETNGVPIYMIRSKRKSESKMAATRLETRATVLLLLLLLKFYSYSKVQHSYKVRKKLTYEAALTIRRESHVSLQCLDNSGTALLWWLPNHAICLHYK